MTRPSAASRLPRRETERKKCQVVLQGLRLTSESIASRKQYLLFSGAWKKLERAVVCELNSKVENPLRASARYFWRQICKTKCIKADIQYGSKSFLYSFILRGKKDAIA